MSQLIKEMLKRGLVKDVRPISEAFVPGQTGDLPKVDTGAPQTSIPAPHAAHGTPPPTAAPTAGQGDQAAANAGEAPGADASNKANPADEASKTESKHIKAMEALGSCLDLAGYHAERLSESDMAPLMAQGSTEQLKPMIDNLKAMKESVGEMKSSHEKSQKESKKPEEEQKSESRLYESKEIHSLAKGVKFTSPHGYQIEITDVTVDNSVQNYTTWIHYKFSKDDKKGAEQNTVENFRKNILGYKK